MSALFTSANEQTEQFIKLIAEPGQVIELRKMIPGRRGAISGYFADHGELIKAAGELSGTANLYITLNPAHPDTFHRSPDHIGTDNGASDCDIISRRLLLIDCDPERISGIASTDAELQAGIERAQAIRNYLDSLGWAAPILANSGNGGHLLYRIDLPTDDSGLVAAVLKCLAAKFGDEAVKVDTSVSNPARISRLYGTLNIKGGNTPERPWRLSEIIEAPERLELVSREQLEALAGQRPAALPGSDPLAEIFGIKPFDIKGFLDRHGIEYQERPDDKRGVVYQLRQCPFVEHSEEYKSGVYLWNGEPCFHCFAGKCDGRNWKDFCTAVKGSAGEPAAEPCKPERKANIVTRIVELALDKDELFHTPDGAAFVVYEHGGVKYADIFSERYALLLRTRYGDKYGDSVPPAKLNQALLDLEGHAIFKRPEFPISLRCAAANGSIYLDTGNERQDVVKVSAFGWNVESVPDSVRFRRSEQMRAFPNPEAGNIELLKPFVNVSKDDWPLVVGWLLTALNPSIECPILSLVGEAGSAKSTTANILQRFVDPQAGDELPGFPRKEQDVMVAAHNSWLLAFDNLSKLSQEQSDVLCRIVTGGSFQTRKLYSDSSLITLRARRPMVITSVEDVISASDLADRAIVLPLMKPDKPRLKIELFAELDKIKGKVFGALLTGMAAGMKGFDTAKVERSPRMAEFARFVTAAETAMGFEPGQTMAAYERTQKRTAFALVDDSPLATAIVERLQSEQVKGTAREIRELIGEGDWPSKPTAFGNALTFIAPSLRGIGVVVERRPRDGMNYWSFSKN